MKKISDFINLFQIFGILIIAIGSLIVLYLNELVGTILIAFGTLSLTYGGSVIGKKQSERSSVEFQEKMTAFEKRLMEAQKLPLNQKKTEISNIENEFMVWASKFTSKKNEIELVYQKNKLAEEEYIIAKSIEARPYYIYVIDTIRNILKAYGAASSSAQIDYVSQKNLFEKFFISYSDRLQTKNPPYEATVSFNKIAKWEINIVNHADCVEWKGGPQLNISQEPFNTKDNAVKSKEQKFLVGIVFDLNEKIIRVATSDAYFSNKLKETYPINNYENHIKNILRVLVEYQLSLID